MLSREKRNQRKLPGFEKVEVVKKKSKYPEPRIRRYRAPKKFEIIHRPLDLNFRGQLNKWLNNIQKKIDFKKFLSRQEIRIINFYLFPQKQGKTWLNQKEVMKIVMNNPRANLKKILVNALLAIWHKNKENK